MRSLDAFVDKAPYIFSAEFGAQSDLLVWASFSFAYRDEVITLPIARGLTESRHFPRHALLAFGAFDRCDYKNEVVAVVVTTPYPLHIDLVESLQWKLSKRFA